MRARQLAVGVRRLSSMRPVWVHRQVLLGLWLGPGASLPPRLPGGRGLRGWGMNRKLHGRIVRGRAETVYPTITDGTVTLVHSDGPYGLRKAAWDKVRDLAAWYRPHIAAWTMVCAPSASIYLWNTAEGWATIHPEMVAAGWEFKSLIVWDKGQTGSKATFGAAKITEWPDVTEVCGFYQRNTGEVKIVTELAAELERRRVLGRISRAAIDLAAGTSNVSQYWWRARGWQLPSERCWEILRSLAPSVFWDEWAQWKDRERQARQARAPFQLPEGATNVWRHPPVRGAERLTGSDGAPLHPCQKPLVFAEKIIEASSRPGDLILEPFAGTCRIAIACERLASATPCLARRYICVEQDEDGRDYIGAVNGLIGVQIGLFGRPAGEDCGGGE